MTQPPLPIPALPLSPLEVRLRSLERQVKRQRRIFSACLLTLLFVIIFMGAIDALIRWRGLVTFQTVRITDAQGKLRAFLTAEGDTPRLAFVDHAGGKWVALELGAEKAGPYISFLENHRHRLVISRDVMRVRDAQFKERIWLGLADEQGVGRFPAIYLSDGSRQHRLRLTARSRGPAIAFRDGAGRNQLDLFGFETAHGIVMYDDKRVTRTSWGLWDNEPSISIFDPSKRVRLTAGWKDPLEDEPDDADGSVALRLLDPRGHTRASLSSAGGDYGLTLYDVTGHPRSRAERSPRSK